MDLRQIECFLAVARHLHFGRAAESLHLGQATVSESVARLERELNGPLFTRTTRRVELTPLGETFLAEAGPGYQALRRAYERTQAASLAHGTEVVVGYCHDSERRLMLNLVPELRRRHAQPVIDFQPLSATKMVEGLHTQELDIGMCYTPVLDESLESRYLAESALVAIVRTGHPFALRSDLSLAEIVAEPIVLLDRHGQPDALRPRDRRTRWHRASVAARDDGVGCQQSRGAGAAPASASPSPSRRRCPRHLSTERYASRYRDAPTIEKVLVWRKEEPRRVVSDLVDLLIANFHKRTVRLGQLQDQRRVS